MWDEEDNQLHRSFKFKNFIEAFTFIIKVEFAVEKMNHHINWSNECNRVDIILYTHEDRDIITEKDIILSKEIDEIFKKQQL